MGGFGDDFFEIFEEKLELISNSNFELCDGSFDPKFYIRSKPKNTKKGARPQGLNFFYKKLMTRHILSVIPVS